MGRVYYLLNRIYSLINFNFDYKFLIYNPRLYLHSSSFSYIIISDKIDINYIIKDEGVLLHMVYLACFLSLIFALLNYILSFFLFFLQSDFNKTAYECGFEPFDEAMRHPFDIHFYIVGILFLIFDLEISCLLPASFNIGINGFSLNIVSLFLAIITLGFILEYKIGALDWFFFKFIENNKNIVYQNIPYLICINEYFQDAIKQIKISYDLVIMYALEYKSIYEIIMENILSFEQIISLILEDFLPITVLSYFPIMFTPLVVWICLLNMFLLFFYIIYTICNSFIWYSKVYKIGKSKTFLHNISQIQFKLLEKHIKLVIIVTISVAIVFISGLDKIYYFINNILLIHSSNFFFQIIILFLAFLSLKKSKNVFFSNNNNNFLLFPIFFLSILFLLLLLILSNHIIVLILTIIGINLSLYIFLFESTRKIQLESAVKYFFLSTVAIALLYLSTILIYSFTSNLDFIYIGQRISIMLVSNQKTLNLILFLLLSVFFFKVGVFPSNFFLPEIYKGLPPYLFIYLSLPVKAAFIGFIINFFKFFFLTVNYNLIVYYLYVLILFSFIIGPFGAISASNLYSFFAYISVTQLGWLLLGLLNNQSVISINIYYLYYFLISAILVYIFTDNKLRLNGSISNFIVDSRNIHWDWLLFLILLTLTGLPPSIAFIPKFFILLTSYTSGFWSIVFIALISSIFSGYYYIRFAYLIMQKLKERIRSYFFWNLILFWNFNYIYRFFIILLSCVYIYILIFCKQLFAIF